MAAPAAAAPTPADHGVAGLCGSVASCLLLYPIDQVRAVQQSADAPAGEAGRTVAICRALLREGGVRRLYAGLYATILALGASSISYTWMYELVRSVLHARLSRSLRVGENLLVAFCVGVVNAWATSPLWVASTRLRLQARRTASAGPFPATPTTTLTRSATPSSDALPPSEDSSDAEAEAGGRPVFARLKSVPRTLTAENLALTRSRDRARYSESPSHSPSESRISRRGSVQYDGVLHALEDVWLKGEAWSGFASSVLLCTNPAIQYASYEFLRQRVLEGRVAIDPWNGFVFGAVAKALATVLTYPLQVVQTRMREPGATGDTLSAIRAVYHRDGAGGFFRGMGSKLAHTVLNSALIFAIYEGLLAAVVRARARLPDGAGRACVALAAVAAAAAKLARRPAVAHKAVQVPSSRGQKGSTTTADSPPHRGHFAVARSP